MAEAWRRDGYIVVRGLYGPDRVAWLRETCERILARWRISSPETNEPGGDAEATSMRHLNHPGYFEGDPDGLRAMLSAIADAKVLDLCRDLFGREPLFRCTSLFMNPAAGRMDGNWHRDSQFLCPGEAEERQKITAAGGVSDHIQLQIALAPSDDIEYVPGSHLRWDTPEEHAVRRADGGANSRARISGAVRVALEPGDAVGFNAYGLHRGRYHADRLRRTFMVTCTDSQSPVSDYFSNQPWFLNAGYLDGLGAAERGFFEAFIAQYRQDWTSAIPNRPVGAAPTDSKRAHNAS
jgi:hypothetical protein